MYDEFLYSLAKKLALISYTVATGWISVNMNDHNINGRPRNTESQ